MNFAEQTTAITEQVTTSNTVKAVFHNSLGNSRYLLKSGKTCIFLAGQYLTSDQEEIKELMEEIAAGNPHIFIDANKLVIETKFVDPIEAIRAKLLDELKQQGRLIAAAETDYGTSEQGKLNAGNTRDIAEAMSGSSSGDGVSSAAGTAKIVAGPR